jgi:selenium metabolism protein YedF
MQKIIDARGEQCHIPVIKAKNELTRLITGDSLYMLVDNEISAQHLLKMADQLKIKTESKKIKNDFAVEFFYKGQPLSVSEMNKDEYSKISAYNNITGLQNYKKKVITIIINADTIEDNEENLGKILIKNFLGALNNMENLPKTIIFCSGGVKLACKGSEYLSDLKQLEKKGVEIFSCDLSLDFYLLKEKLAVGKTIDMYSIVEKQMLSDLIIKP